MQMINWLALGVVALVPLVAAVALRDELPRLRKSLGTPGAAPVRTLDDVADDIAQRHLDDPRYIHFN